MSPFRGEASARFWTAPAERSGDGAFERTRGAGVSAGRRVRKRCRRCALPPHSIMLARHLKPFCQFLVTAPTSSGSPTHAGSGLTAGGWELRAVGSRVLV